MSIGGFLGQQVDFANTRLGRGGSVSARMVVRPTDHVNLDLVSVAEWLNVPGPAGRDERLFTAQIQRLKGTYNFDRRTFLRLIGQWVQTKRTPSLYRAAVPRRSGQLQGSALLGFRLNWQSALFLGYGDTRALDEREDLARTDRQIFVKLSYALQR
jgi:hypothetical protein